MVSLPSSPSARLVSVTCQLPLAKAKLYPAFNPDSAQVSEPAPPLARSSPAPRSMKVLVVLPDVFQAPLVPAKAA